MKFNVFPLRVGSTITCPRCGRDVYDTLEGRRAHGISCVKIPEHRPDGWGKGVG